MPIPGAGPGPRPEVKGLIMVGLDGPLSSWHGEPQPDYKELAFNRAQELHHA
jgi:hypothetical protein